ncbi:MAG: Mth938-like domain-containing protein [Mangrovicoccus sp.]|nr:Mth938-like domain-containing protein [Mangrovicoccus sp.]
MQFTEMNFGAQLPVTGYGPGFFRVGHGVIKGGLLLLQNTPKLWGGYEDLGDLGRAAGQIDVLLLGTGAEIAHPPQAFRQMIEQAGIGIDPMSSPSACRTYNILLSEGRRVGLAALPV